MNPTIYEEACRKFREAFDHEHTAAAYSPGRVEILGNHTDYNEGFVLSIAIDRGTCFLVSPADDGVCRCVAGDVMETATFGAATPQRVAEPTWLNYIIGTFAKLQESHSSIADCAFNGLLLGNIPLGAGLSSSAALEMSCGLALCASYGLSVDKLDLAQLGQTAEHDYAGVRCGLLDQISSLYGKRNHLIMTDFRTLAVETIPLPEDICFLVCNTRARHALVDGEYNRRREQCEEAAAFFAGRLKHPVSALRDVTTTEWEQHHADMDPETARRALHPIGENERVCIGRDLLAKGDVESFGRLMFESHASSRANFENSCRELDFLVDTAGNIPEILGARLSGGGFGGSAVMLIHPNDIEAVSSAITAAYADEFGHACEVCSVAASDGGHII